MAKVLLESTRRPGVTKRVSRRDARLLVKMGGWKVADSKKPAGGEGEIPRIPVIAPSAPEAEPEADEPETEDANVNREMKTEEPGEDYASMDYQDLVRLARERGIESRKKAEIVAALTKGRYGRRDMRAGE